MFAALVTYCGCYAARRYLLNRHPTPAGPRPRETEFWKGRVRLRELWNEGAAFGLPIPKEVLSLAPAAALGVLWTRRDQCPLGAGLILGGGLSNLWERVRYGRVYDYVQFPKAPGALRRYVFNLADFAILGGGLILLAGQGIRRTGKKGRE